MKKKETNIEKFHKGEFRDKLQLTEYYCDGRSMWNACEGKESHIEFWWRNLKNRPLGKSRYR